MTMSKIQVELKEIKNDLKSLLDEARKMALSAQEFESYATDIGHKLKYVEKDLRELERELLEPPPKKQEKTNNSFKLVHFAE